MREIDKLYMIHDFLSYMYYEIQDYKEANEVEISEDEMKRELEKFILLFK